MDGALKGFKCKDCDKWFFAIINDPEYISEGIKEIRNYKKLGYKFVELTKSDMEKGFCVCKEK